MTLPVIQVDPAAPWLSAELKAHLAKGKGWRYETRLCPAVKKVLRTRKPIAVSSWAGKHRVLQRSSRPGPWRNDVTPYLVGIMDAAGHPAVETVVICKAPQVGVSEAAHNFVGYTIDRAPGPVMYVYPDIATARENSQDRIQPMIMDSPRLKDYLTGADDDVTSLRINLSHVAIYLAWATSAARLANKPIRYLILDEIDKYASLASKGEAGPISLAEKRTITYAYNRKIWKISTPTTESGPIWQAYTTDAQARFEFHCRCPMCGGFGPMRFTDIRWPRESDGKHPDPAKVKARRMASYMCPACGAAWDDEDRNAAARAGKWVEKETGVDLFRYLNTERPKVIGFHVPSWISEFTGLSEAAAAFLMGLKSVEKLKDFQNNHAAEPWVLHQGVREEDAILALKDHRPAGLVPGGGEVATLICGADTQDAGWWFTIWAFGWGLAEPMWEVRSGYTDTLAGLHQAMWDDRYTDAEGNIYTVELVVVDSGGHRTTEIYDWCRMNFGRAVAFKGEGRMAQPTAWSAIDTYPGSSKRIPGGIQLLRANVNTFKNKLANKLAIAPGDPGGVQFSSEFDPIRAGHFTAEVIDEKTGLWVNRQGRENHLWDCAVMAMVGAEVKGVRFWGKRGPQQGPEAPSRRDPAADRRDAPRRVLDIRPQWLRNR